MSGSQGIAHAKRSDPVPTPVEVLQFLQHIHDLAEVVAARAKAMTPQAAVKGGPRELVAPDQVHLVNGVPGSATPSKVGIAATISAARMSLMGRLLLAGYPASLTDVRT